MTEHLLVETFLFRRICPGAASLGALSSTRGVLFFDSQLVLPTWQDTAYAGPG